MRFPTVLPVLLLPTLSLAQEQKPLMASFQGWFDAAKAYIPSSIATPIDAAAAKVASKNVVPIDKDNWFGTIRPSTTTTSATAGSETYEPWMVLVSGGNKTCFGQCANVESAWNKSAALFAADPSAPNLGYINCDESPILCSIWFAGPPAVWYIEVPTASVAPGQPAPSTPIHVIPLNTTTTTAQDIVSIHTQKTYLERPLYTGAFHPWDGYLAKAWLNVPIGYVLYGFGLVPSWAMMLIISFVSRTFMSRRLAPPPAPGRPQPGQAAPAAT